MRVDRAESDQAVDAALHQPPELDLLPGGLVTAVADQDRVVGRGGRCCALCMLFVATSCGMYGVPTAGRPLIREEVADVPGVQP